MGERWLTPKEVFEEYNIPNSTLTNWIYKFGMTRRYEGKKMMIPEKELIKFIDSIYLNRLHVPKK